MMLDRVLARLVLAGAIVILFISPAAWAHWIPPNPQTTRSVDPNTAESSGPVIAGDIGGGYTFKGPMAGPFSIYNKNGELVGTTQNQRAKIITNDPDLQKIYSDNQRRNGGQIVPLSMHVEGPANVANHMETAPNNVGTGASGSLGRTAADTAPEYTASNGWGVTLRDTAKNVTRITLIPPSTGNAMQDALRYPMQLDFSKGSSAYVALGAVTGHVHKGSDLRGDVISIPNTAKNSMNMGKLGIDLNNMRPQVEALEEAVNHGHVTPNFDKKALKRFEKAGDYKP